MIRLIYQGLIGLINMFSFYRDENEHVPGGRKTTMVGQILSKGGGFQVARIKWFK